MSKIELSIDEWAVVVSALTDYKNRLRRDQATMVEEGDIQWVRDAEERIDVADRLKDRLYA